MKNKRLIIGIVYIILGLVLGLLSFLGIVDEWWQSFGIAILIVGIADIFRHIKYLHNTEYREKVDLSNNDERIRFIAMKAWSWSGYLFVIIAAIASIALKAFGYDEYSQIAGLSVCLIILLYWINYCILRKKY